MKINPSTEPNENSVLPDQNRKTKVKAANLIEIDERNKIEYYEGSWRILHWDQEVPLTNLNVWNCKINHFIKLGHAMAHFFNMYVVSNALEIKEISDKLLAFEAKVIEICHQTDQKIKELYHEPSH